MRLTCYLDESGTHDSSATTVMAGYVAHNAAWSKFEKRWAKAHERFGLTHFHGTDAKKRNGQYKGWNQQRLDAYFYITDKLANQQSLFGLVCRLDNAEYDQIYKVTGQRPKGMVAPDSKYGLCFRGCISFIVRVLLQKYPNKKSLTLDVVLEAGHRNVGDAQRIFADMKTGAEQGIREILGQLTIAEKLSCAGVQAGDQLAYAGYQVEKGPVEFVTNPLSTEGLRKSKALAKANGRFMCPHYRLDLNRELLQERKDVLLSTAKTPSPKPD